MSEEMTAAVDTAAVAKNGPGRPADGDGADLVAQLMEQARAAGLELTDDGRLLQQLTKRVLESALDGEITDHLGYDKGDPAGKNGGNSRNGVRSKTVLTDVGPVEIDVPRDRDASFTPQIVKKRQHRLSGVDDMVISLSATGLTTGEIQVHLAEVYGAEVLRQTTTISAQRNEPSGWINHTSCARTEFWRQLLTWDVHGRPQGDKNRAATPSAPNGCGAGDRVSRP